MTDKILLHIGCGPHRFPGFQNSEREELDITQPWPHGDSTVDGITSSHVLIEIPWRPLVVALREMHRVLKPDGVLRIGTPHIDSGYDLNWLLGWGNINLFSEELLTKVLRKIGFAEVRSANFQKTWSKHREIVVPDNRLSETLYLEAFKTTEGVA